MIWILYAVPCLAVIYLAARFSRFRRFAEPILSVAAAIGLISAFLIWIRDDNAAPQTSITPPKPTIAATELVLSGMTYTRSQPETSYRVSGTVTNNSALMLDYFRLTVTLEDCPQAACTTVGSDTALILSRVLPGRSQAFETFYTISNPRQIDPTAPQWRPTISEIAARPQP